MISIILIVASISHVVMCSRQRTQLLRTQHKLVASATRQRHPTTTDIYPLCLVQTPSKKQPIAPSHSRSWIAMSLTTGARCRRQEARNVPSGTPRRPGLHMLGNFGKELPEDCELNELLDPEIPGLAFENLFSF